MKKILLLLLLFPTFVYSQKLNEYYKKMDLSGNVFMYITDNGKKAVVPQEKMTYRLINNCLDLNNINDISFWVEHANGKREHYMITELYMKMSRNIDEFGIVTYTVYDKNKIYFSIRLEPFGAILRLYEKHP